MPAYRARQCVQRSLRPSAGAALQMRPQDGGAARLALAALVLLLAADGGLAKKKKKSKKAKREWAKAKAPPPAPELPTEEGWAYMDDTMPAVCARPLPTRTSSGLQAFRSLGLELSQQSV